MTFTMPRVSKLSFRLSRALSAGRNGSAAPASRQAVLVTLLRKRAAARNAGLLDLERQLREQIRWSLPVLRLDDAPPEPSAADTVSAASARTEPSPGGVPAPAVKPARPPRQAILWGGELFWDDEMIPVQLRNISAEGAMLSGRARLRTGKEVVFALKSAGTFFATVRWSGSGLIGLRFDKCFDVGKLLRIVGGRDHGRTESRPGILTPLYLRSETEADSPWAARWEKLRPEDL